MSDAASLLREVRRWLGTRQGSTPFNLDLSDSPSWDERAEAAATLLTAAARPPFTGGSSTLRIADFGCGDERLKRVLADRLSQPHRYRGYDLLPQRETVVEIDLTRSLPDEEFDVVFCLGLLEYIDPLVPFLARLHGRYPAAIVSYAVADPPKPLRKRERRSRGWRNHYTVAALEREFDRVGFIRSNFCLTNQGRTGLWLLTAP
jgi:SAM-dependent methyltransferase